MEKTGMCLLVSLHSMSNKSSFRIDHVFSDGNGDPIPTSHEMPALEPPEWGPGGGWRMDMGMRETSGLLPSTTPGEEANEDVDLNSGVPESWYAMPPPDIPPKRVEQTLPYQ